MKNSPKTRLAQKRNWTKFLIRGVEASLKNISMRTDCLSPNERYNVDVALETVQRITNNWDIVKELQLLEKSYDKQTV